jgi:phage baseplate assembly protein W
MLTNILGFGPTPPMQRVGTDFTTAEGELLIAHAIAQILGTRPGELPWDPDFGIDLEAYRHKNLSGALVQAMTDDIVSVLKHWEPRITISQCSAFTRDSAVYVKVRWSVTSQALPPSNVIIGPVVQEVQV